MPVGDALDSLTLARLHYPEVARSRRDRCSRQRPLRRRRWRERKTRATEASRGQRNFGFTICERANISRLKKTEETHGVTRASSAASASDTSAAARIFPPNLIDAPFLHTLFYFWKVERMGPRLHFTHIGMRELRIRFSLDLD